MSKRQITKDIIKCEVLKLKRELDLEWVNKHSSDPKLLAHLYLNKLLDKLDEYRY